MKGFERVSCEFQRSAALSEHRIPDFLGLYTVEWGWGIHAPGFGVVVSWLVQQYLTNVLMLIARRCLRFDVVAL